MEEIAELENLEKDIQEEESPTWVARYLGEILFSLLSLLWILVAYLIYRYFKSKFN